MTSSHPAHPNPSIGPAHLDPPALSLEDLDRYDAHEHRGGDEQRYLCPLPACGAHQDPQRHRAFCVNMATGLWNCKRCGARGKLREFWEDRGTPPPRRRRRATAAALPSAPKTPRPDVARRHRVGGERRFLCQALDGRRAIHVRQDVALHLADGTTQRDKQVWWEDGAGGRGLPEGLHTGDLLYMPTPLAEIPAGATLLVAEGETATAAAIALGVRAVGLVCGASGTPSAPVLDALAAYCVILSPDNDDVGRGLMRRVAAGLLERGAAPRWLGLPVGEHGDLVDYQAAGGTAEDLAARVAVAPAAYSEVVAALRAELGDGAGGDCAALEAQLGEAHGQIRELKANLRAADAELAALKRQDPRAFVRRLVPELTAMQADKKTKGLGLPLLVLLDERLANVEAGKPAETPLSWWATEREEQLGRSADWLRTKVLDPLEEHEILDREYQQLGIRGDGEQGQRLRLSVASAVPTDLVDGLRFIRRQLLHEKPRRVRPKRSKGCAPCRSAVCAEHPTAAIENYVEPRCSECGHAAAVGHLHARRRAATHVAPAVMFPVRPRNSVEPPREDVRPRNSVEPPLDGRDVLDAAFGVTEQLVAGLELDTLAPDVGRDLKLKLYGLVPLVWPRGGESPPADGECCDVCRSPLGPAEMLRCDRCATAGVAS